MKKIYFANGLFTEADWDFNLKVVKEIRKVLKEKVYVYLPQENGDINDKTKFAGSSDIANSDNEHLDDCDILIAVLDGEVIDPGVACEIGYAAAKGKKIFGLSTDSRVYYEQESPGKIHSVKGLCESQYHYKNLYVVGNINNNGFIFSNYEALIGYLLEII